VSAVLQARVVAVLYAVALVPWVVQEVEENL
jgi:hypothetical protein